MHPLPVPLMDPRTRKGTRHTRHQGTRWGNRGSSPEKQLEARASKPIFVPVDTLPDHAMMT